ncbi:redoxin domain-containing protein [Chloroflexi bacterium TSY]|nr:redoxin domain-containing protein [Chloroflexi bacterium TSY]
MTWNQRLQRIRIGADFSVTGTLGSAVIQQLQAENPAISFPLLVDPDETVFAQYQTVEFQGIPAVYFIDANGNIQDYLRGAVGEEQQRLALARILE